MSQASFESLLNEARKLPLEEQQQQLIDKLIQEVETDKKQKALEAVERTHGRIKGIDRETLISIAEDEEFCGY